MKKPLSYHVLISDIAHEVDLYHGGKKRCLTTARCLSGALIQPGLPAVRGGLHLGAMRLHPTSASSPRPRPGAPAVGRLLEARDELARQGARDIRDGRGVVAVLAHGFGRR